MNRCDYCRNLIPQLQENNLLLKYKKETLFPALPKESPSAYNTQEHHKALFSPAWHDESHFGSQYQESQNSQRYLLF